MRTAIEKAMHERREEAKAEAYKRFRGLQEVIVSFSFGDCVIDVKQKNGDWIRFQHTTEVDVLLAEQAEAASRRREVKHGVS
jgi:hypothetical protein